MKRPKERTVKLDDIVIDQRAQTRADGLDDAHVEQMTDDLKALPAMLVVEVDGKLRLADGFHRYAAFKRAKMLRVPVAVIVGTEDDWVDAFASANEGQKGKHRTREDKRNAVRRCLELRPEWTSRRVAHAAKVSEGLVREVRKYAPEEPAKREGKDGKAYPATKPKPKPEQPVTAGEPVPPPPPPPPPTAPEPVIVRPSDTAGDSERTDTTPPPAEPKPKAAKKGDPAAIPPAPVDAWGIPIQPHAVEAFAAVPDLNELLRLLKQVRGKLTGVCELPGGFLLQKQCKFFTTKSEAGGRWSLSFLDNAIAAVEDATPRHTDCPYHFNPHQTHEVTRVGESPCPICHGTRVAPDLKRRQVPPELVANMKAHYGVTDASKGVV